MNGVEKGVDANREFRAPDVVHNAVRSRRTCKLLGDPSRPWPVPAETAEKLRTTVARCVEDACWAPFHYDRQEGGIPEPFRFHVLDWTVCRRVAARFGDWFPDARANNKLPAMLSVCGGLVLVTWLPNHSLNPESAKSIQINEEHLAAAAAATQNLLVLLTAHGIGTYWSSGGQFRQSEMKRRLEIPEAEELLAAVFVEAEGMPDEGVERIFGKHRERRSSPSQLVRWLTSLESLSGEPDGCRR